MKSERFSAQLFFGMFSWTPNQND